MDSKIPASFWTNDALNTPELLLAAAWLRTHAGINLAGYAEISARRFVFETHLPAEALARVEQALGKGLVREGNGYWLRDFIGDEFGRGQQLAANNMAAAVVRALDVVTSPWVALRVLDEYPELRVRWNAVQSWKGLGRASPRAKAQGARARASEGAGAGGSMPAVGTGRPASVEIVRAYALERGADPAEADSFFDHFEANGWRQGGKTPLRSWQAAFRGWVRRAGQFGKKTSGANGASIEPFDPKVPQAHTGGAQEAR